MSAEIKPPPAPPPGSNFFQRLAFYAPSPREVVPNLWRSVQEASKDISEMKPEDVLKFGEVAISTNSGGKELRILVTGKTGQGKSTLINGLLGASFAREGAGAARCTTEVEVFKEEINGVPVVVFDSPGLQDNTAKEEEYIRSMKETCQKLSLVLYCTKMGNTRLGDDDKKAMKKLTEAFGQGFWNHAVFVLTFANKEDVERWDNRDTDDESEEPPPSDVKAWESLEKKRFQGRLKLWKNELQKFLINEVKVKSSIANGVPVIPTGDHKATKSNPTPLRLRDRENWFQVLWENCSFRVKEQNLFLEINSHRMTAVDEGDDGGQQKMSACQGNDQPRESENRVGKEIPTVVVLPDPVQCNVEVRKSKHEVQTSEKLETKVERTERPKSSVKELQKEPVQCNTEMKESRHEVQTSEKLETKVEQTERPKSSVKELRKKFEIQDNESVLKPTSTSSNTDKRFSLQLDDVTVSPRHEPNKSPAPSKCPPQPPPKPHRHKPQNEVDRRPRSAAFSMRDENELQSKLSEQFCQKNHSSLPSQESTVHQKSMKENMACEDSSEKYDVAVTTLADETIVPEDDGDYIQPCEAPNENTPCEDTPPDEDPKENDSNKTGVVKAGGSFNGLQNQPIEITDKYATDLSINAVEKRFGHYVAVAFTAALQYVTKPHEWFVKLIKKKNRKSIKSN